MKTTSFTIGRLAREAGVNLETVRYYERRGLLPRPPRASPEHSAPNRMVGTLPIIFSAKTLGFRTILIALPIEAFRALNGKSFTHSEFREALERIRAANMRFLPAEYGTHDLAALAEERHWLKREAPGRLRVVIPHRSGA